MVNLSLRGHIVARLLNQPKPMGFAISFALHLIKLDKTLYPLSLAVHQLQKT